MRAWIEPAAIAAIWVVLLLLGAAHALLWLDRPF